MLLGGQARGARFTGAGLTGTVFRDLDLTDTAFDNADTYRAQALRCALDRQRGLAHALSQAAFALCRPPEAWRDLGWLVPDATGALTRYPAETFGPLPEYNG